MTNWAKFFFKTCSVWLQTCNKIPFLNEDAAAEVDLNFHFSGSQGFIKLPVQPTNGMLLFGDYWLVGSKCLASWKHCARVGILLEQSNWKKSKWHDQNSCLK